MTDRREEEQDHSYIKLVLVGDSGVGKTNLISRYVDNKFNVGANPTIGLQFSQKNIQHQGKSFMLQIWDTAGQQRFRSLNKTFYRNSMGALIIFDLNNRNSYQQVPRWISEIRQNLPEEAVLLLVGNKCDIPQPKISVGQALQYAKQEGLGYIQTSAAIGTNVKEAFDLLTKKIIGRVQQLQRHLQKQRQEVEHKFKKKQEIKRKKYSQKNQSIIIGMFQGYIEPNHFKNKKQDQKKKSCCQ